jgi:hypothetical protein
VLLTAAPAAAANGLCKPVLAQAATVWIDEDVEVGNVAGLINGALYLRYYDKDPLVDPAATKPNMVIAAKGGEIHLWVSGTSSVGRDGSVHRQLESLRGYGTGDFAKAVFDLSIVGDYYPGKGGSYEVVGTICWTGTTKK